LLAGPAALTVTQLLNDIIVDYGDALVRHGLMMNRQIILPAVDDPIIEILQYY